MAKYLAVGFWAEGGGGNTFTISRPTDSDDPRTVLDMLCKDAAMSSDDIDTVLLIENGNGSEPCVVKHWRDQLTKLDEECEDE